MLFRSVGFGVGFLLYIDDVPPGHLISVLYIHQTDCTTDCNGCFLNDVGEL